MIKELLQRNISILYKPVRPPYGGGNQFLIALSKEFNKLGWLVALDRVGLGTRAILFNSFNFNFGRVKRLRFLRKRMVHRVDGPISVYRGSDSPEVDLAIQQINHTVAAATIFQSHYSFNKHLEMGLRFKDPVIIPNACDGEIFFPLTHKAAPEGRKIKLAGSAWSDNPKKGLKTFEWLDQNLDFNRYELTFIGRTKGVFKNIKVLEALPSVQLAEVLREQDVYIAASEDDPCSNALIEALASGLPVVFRNSGGHPELVGEAGVGYQTENEILSSIDQVAEKYLFYRKKIKVLSMAEVAKSYLKVLLPESQL